ncbi:MAG TPA: HlyD family efflux transporter periplasmic adaptor subunit [Firmicutes bacterium]|nr:HlyD family efflux transporter periplasmic adaptor subunit [Bacillota bacterium]
MEKSIVPERLKGRGKKRRQQGVGRQWGLIFFTLIILGLIGYGAYSYLIPKEETFQLDFYTYAAVAARDFLETLPVGGTVTPKKTAAIEPQIVGTVEEVFVEEGADVQAGDPLLRLYSPEIVTEKNKAETELSEAQAKLAELGLDQELQTAAQKLNIEAAREEFERAKSDYELQQILYDYGSIPRLDLEKAKANILAAERKVAQSERELELLGRKHAADEAALEKAIAIAGEKLEKAREKMDNFVVKAPFAGRILSLKIPANRLVTAHQDLGELADLSEQAVEMEVAPGQTERFGVGSTVTVNLGSAEYAGRVSYIAPQAKQAADGPTVLVRVDFLEEVSHLRPNSAVTCSIHLGLHKDSLFLPRGAYLSSGQQLFVYVIEGNTARRREVRFGLIEGNNVQILDGLELGEQVIISSYDVYRHLEKIEVLPEGGHAL